MTARIAELRDKQVVSIKDASVVGYGGDIEFDTETGWNHRQTGQAP